MTITPPPPQFTNTTPKFALFTKKLREVASSSSSSSLSHIPALPAGEHTEKQTEKEKNEIECDYDFAMPASMQVDYEILKSAEIVAGTGKGSQKDTKRMEKCLEPDTHTDKNNADEQIVIPKHIQQQEAETLQPESAAKEYTSDPPERNDTVMAEPNPFLEVKLPLLAPLRYTLQS